MYDASTVAVQTPGSYWSAACVGSYIARSYIYSDMSYIHPAGVLFRRRWNVSLVLCTIPGRSWSWLSSWYADSV